MVMTIVVMVNTVGLGISGTEQPLIRLPDRAGGLEDGQPDGQVAGVLGDLGLAALALLAQRLQPRDHLDQQLQDDARGDVGHDAEREHGQLQQRPAAQQVDQLEQAAARVRGLVEADVDVVLGDAGDRQRRAQPEHGDDKDREQQFPAQVRSPEGPEETG
jgi:hypothetical protein